MGARRTKAPKTPNPSAHPRLLWGPEYDAARSAWVALGNSPLDVASIQLQSAQIYARTHKKRFANPGFHDPGNDYYFLNPQLNTHEFALQGGPQLVDVHGNAFRIPQSDELGYHYKSALMGGDADVANMHILWMQCKEKDRARVVPEEGTTVQLTDAHASTRSYDVLYTHLSPGRTGWVKLYGSL